MNKDNPYIKNIPGVCTVCGKIAYFDQYGNGICKNCGWEMERDEEQMGKMQGISYPMLVPVWRAREQYKQGKPFKATFEDFINGLYFYSEMEFKHKGKIYVVYFVHNTNENIICFESDKISQKYLTREDFKDKANIDGQLLKDIWDTEIDDPGYLFD